MESLISRCCATLKASSGSTNLSLVWYVFNRFSLTSGILPDVDASELIIAPCDPVPALVEDFVLVEVGLLVVGGFGLLGVGVVGLGVVGSFSVSFGGSVTVGVVPVPSSPVPLVDDALVPVPSGPEFGVPAVLVPSIPETGVTTVPAPDVVVGNSPAVGV